MKIRSKISLIYTLSVGGLIFALSVFVYFLASRFTNEKFIQVLEERAIIVAKKHLEEDELSARIYQQILNEHLRSLPNEQEWIIDIKDGQKPALPVQLPAEFTQSLTMDGKAYFTTNESKVVGMKYYDNQGDFIIIVSATDLFGEEYLGQLRTILTSGGVISIAIILIISYLFSQKIISPIREVIVHVNEISANKLNLRLSPQKSEDELAELKKTFNKMLDRLEASFEIQSSFLSHASHELKTPITTIIGETEIALRKKRPAEEYVHSLQVVHKSSERLHNIIDSITALVKTGSPIDGLKPIKIDLRDFLPEVITHVTELYPNCLIKSEFEMAGVGCHVQGNKDLLRISLANLLENAIKFTSEQEVEINVKTTADGVCLTITDKGIGILPDDLNRIYDPFFRGENVQGIKGHGLGLSLARKIIQLHHGSLSIDSVIDSGTSVSIFLPSKIKDPWL